MTHAGFIARVHFTGEELCESLTLPEIDEQNETPFVSYELQNYYYT